MNEEIWQQILNGDKGKEKDAEEEGLDLQDDVFTEDELEDEDEDELEMEEEGDWGDEREFISDDDESGDEISDLEDLETVEVRQIHTQLL